MRKLLLLSLLLSALVGAHPHFELAGRHWQTWRDALQTARDQNKPILLVQMLGDLDETWC